MITRETAKKVGRRLLNNLWFHLAVNAAFFSLMVAVLPFFFETNDDSTMCLIANGVLSGKPDGHLVFINALYGWVVAGLYMISRSVEWYTLLMSGWQILAMTIISYLISKDQSMHRWLRAGLLLVFYVLWVKLIVLFQFTSTSGLLAFSGCLALLQKDTRWRIAGVVAIAIASLLRFESAVLIGILFAPYLIYRWNQEKRLGYWVIGMIVLTVGLRLADNLCYQSQEWKYYREFNAIRGQINDNPNAWLLSEEQLPEGLSMENYKLLLGTETDAAIITLPVIRQLKEALGNSITLRQMGHNILHLPDFWKPFLVFCFGMLLIIITHKNKKMRIVAACMLVLYVGIWYTMGAIALIKERVVLCMAMPMLYMTIYGNAHLLDGIKRSKRKHRAIIAMFVMMLLIVAWSWNRGIYRTVDNREYVSRETKKYIDPLINQVYALEPDMMLYIWPGIAYINHVSPWHHKDIPYRIVGLGWLTNCPFLHNELGSHMGFVNSKIRYLSERKTPPEYLRKAIERNYGVPVRIEEVCHGKYHAMFKFVVDEQ